ncbi:MAG TPA: bifunctional glutamate N-acetyltransferase/amino-acid acetyltransferase ArgJ [Candidatus Altiarchaeales archaeon]|nr:bifunctional glutamate N-acetyltransferase/amino-acid acetyltransferase ArgJ [Candidatus Altiarchaeales archaeon]
MEELDVGVCIGGFKAAGVRDGKYGVALIVADGDCEYVGAYTRNAVKAAPVELMMERTGPLRAVIANSGNANCCMKTGVDDAKKIVDEFSKILGCSPEGIGVASTGIIGRKIDVEKVTGLAYKAFEKLGDDAKSIEAAAKSLMTTDSFSKSFAVDVNGVKVGGIAKGAGMIDPSMATMLCFITTNARLSKEELGKTLCEVVDETFNMICVDGDMSTNDTVMLLSNQTQACSREDFKTALGRVCVEIAKMIAFDGEGATKRVTVEVKGAKTIEDARKAVKAISRSNLVRTAIAGGNPNWGRITAAVGTVVDYDWRKMSISYSGGGETYMIVECGVGQDLKPAEKILRNRDLKLTVNLAIGDASAVGYTCDMTEAYVKINKEYS